MEVAILLVLLIGLMIPAALIFWAMYRSTSLTERLHPLTPEQRRRKRKVYAVMIPVMGVAIALAAVIGSGGTGAVVAVVILAAILLVDALLTPWLHYRRAKRKASSS
jgi:predicted PurR-regulated permease PerM